ncbi:MAG TPA: rhodanese-like domain-containing protein, partial [Chitinophagaceae bacterium]
QTGISYTIISFNELCGMLGRDNKPMVIDVRPDSGFRHISRDAKENAMGTIKGSVSIPLEVFSSGNADIPKGRDIILVDVNGDASAKAAILLTQNGYKNVSVLIEGIDRLLNTDKKNAVCRDVFYNSPIAYKTITAGEYGEYSKANSNYILLDVRTADEFANKHKDNWRNIGHLKNAVNIPVADISTRYTELDKNKDILIYAFGSGKETFEAANALQKLGFTKLTVIYGGIFNMRWTAGNVKGQSYLKDFVVDIPEINR